MVVDNNTDKSKPAKLFYGFIFLGTEETILNGETNGIKTNKFLLTTNDNIPPEQYEEIKKAIHSILNNQP